MFRTVLTDIRNNLNGQTLRVPTLEQVQPESASIQNVHQILIELHSIQNNYNNPEYLRVLRVSPDIATTNLEVIGNAIQAIKISGLTNIKNNLSEKGLTLPTFGQVQPGNANVQNVHQILTELQRMQSSYNDPKHLKFLNISSDNATANLEVIGNAIDIIENLFG